MDLLNGNIRNTYFKYLSAAFGSAIIGSIYSFVDTIVVGRYHGPTGAAALAIFAPIWNILFGLGLLFGIGGAVILSTIRGKQEDIDKQNGYFTTAFIACMVLGAFLYLLFWGFDRQILLLFGADNELLPLCLEYIIPIKFVIPAYIFSQMLAAFLRNDNAPERATAAVLAGGGFNIFGDIFFTFIMDLGILGAGIATAAGNVITLCIMCSHFLTRKNTLGLVPVKSFKGKLIRIIRTGFATFFIDVAMGIVTLLLNHRILRYMGSDALAVYGVIINISTCVQSCAYSVGQAAQPIISINYGSGSFKRIRELLYWALLSTAAFALIWTTLTEALPLQIIGIFMTPTVAVAEISRTALRLYGLSFMLLPLNVFSTYFFQAMMSPKHAFVVSVSRGLVISGMLIILMPLVFPAQSLWLAMPLTELITAIYVIYNMTRLTRRLDR